MLRYAVMLLWAGLAAVANAELVVEPDPLWMRVWKHTPHYFIGTYGIVAAIAMAAAAYWLIRYYKRRERSVFFANAFLAALLAVVLSNLTYSDITGRIRVDTRAEEEAGRQRQREARANRALTIKDRVEEKRFAEDSEASLKELEKAGTKVEDEGGKGTGEKAAVSVAPGIPEPSDDGDPLYRKGGKKERSAAVAEKGVVDASAVTAKVKQESHWRFMLENDKYRSIFYGRLLLKLSSFMFWLTLVGVILDYLLRFNRTFDYFLPLPISLLRLDRLPEFLMLGPKTKGVENTPKCMAVYCRGIAPDRLARFLEDVILKGETFLYFGERDPLPGMETIHRLTFGTLHLLPVRKFVCSDRQPWNDGEFVLESTWFGRGCFVVEGQGLAERMAQDASEFLTFRQRTRAFASRTLHVVWDHPSPPPPRLARELLLRGGQVNIRTVVFSRDFPEGVARDVFKEAYDSFPEPRLYPKWPGYVLRGAPACVLSWAFVKCWHGVLACWRVISRRPRRPMVRSEGAMPADSGIAHPVSPKSDANKELAESLRHVGVWLNSLVERRQRRAVEKREAKAHPELRRRNRPVEPGKVARVFMAVGRGFGRFFAFLARTARKVAPRVAMAFVGAGRVVGRVSARGSKGVRQMLGRLSAWMKERSEKQAAEKARREEEGKRLAEARRQAGEKAKQEAAAKATAAKEAKAMAAAAAKEAAEEAAAAAKEATEKEAAEKAALPGAGSLVKKDEDAAALRAKLTLQDRLKAKQAERKQQLAEKKTSIAQMIKAKQAAAQARPAGSLIKADEAESSDGVEAVPAAPVAAAKDVPVSSPTQPTPQPSVVEQNPEAVSEAKAKPDETAERQAKEKAERESRERAEMESRVRAELEEKARKEREESERQARSKAEEEAKKARERTEAESRIRAELEEKARRDREESERQARAKTEEEAKKAREQAAASEKARLEREEVERQATAKAEREARERAEQEARAKAAAEEKLRKEREEAERQAKEKVEREEREARIRAEVEEKLRREREESERQARAKVEEEAKKKAVATQQPSSQPAVPAAIPPAGAAKPEAVAGAKRFVIVRKAGEGPAKSPAVPQLPTPPPAAVRPPSPEPALSAVKTPAAPAATAVPARTEQEEAGGDAEAPPIRSESVPESAAHKDAKRIVVMKKQAGGIAKPPPMQPRPQTAQPQRAPIPPSEPPPEPDADDIRFHCPHCGQKLAAPRQLVGRQLPCTHCKKSIVVPMETGHSAPNAIPPSRSTIVAAPMPPPAAPQVRVSFVPPRQMTQPPGQVRPQVFGGPPQPQHPQQPEQNDAPFKFFCPFCGQKLAVKREWAGRGLKCPACQKVVVIPSPG